MDVLVTASTNDEGFAPSGCHDANPERLLGPSCQCQIGEFAAMRDFAVVRGSAEFARAREEPFDQLIAPEVDVGWVTIYEYRLWPSPQGNPPELGHKGLLAFPFHHDLQAPHRAGWGGSRGSILLEYLLHTSLVLGGQRFEARGLHHPVQSPKPGDVLSEQVVLREAAILRLGLLYKGVILIAQQCWSGPRCAVAHVQRALLFDDSVRQP